MSTRAAFVLIMLVAPALPARPAGISRASETHDQIVEARIDSLLSVMTLEEKCGQLNQIGGVRTDSLHRIIVDDTLHDAIKSGMIGSFLNVTGAENTRELQRIAVEESRLRIPLIFGLDVIHGFRTVFPIPLAESCTWDTALVREAASIAAREASAAGIHWTFAPMVDIARDPRWGRIAEGSGEDPFLGSAMAAARVKGFQGNDLANTENILACAKHFAAYGAAEGGRDYNVADMSERTLREVYLAPFKAAVDAGVGSLMSSFNEIGGVPSSGNRWLMTDVLRNEWNFKGFVVSDFTAIEEMINHGVTGNREDAGTLAITAGVDMDMVDQIYSHELIHAAQEDKVPIEVINEAVRRILRMKFALGLFNDPYRGANSAQERNAFLTPASIRLARKEAQESIVLLKNQGNILPLSPSLRKIAVVGPLADNQRDMLGSWRGMGREEDVVTPLAGIKAATTSSIFYEKGCGIEGQSGYRLREAVQAVHFADVAIVVVGESADMSGEAASRSSIGLPGLQQQFVEAMVATGTPVVLVVVNGRPLTLEREAGHVAALLEAWQPGIQAGHAIADILFGTVNPSGKLSVSFPRSTGQIPVYYDHKNTGRPITKEQYTSKYLDIPNTPLFPFGYGLSYTTFAYRNLTLSSSTIGMNDVLRVSVDVTNSGKRRGDEIVQLYVHDQVGSVTRPVKELKGFKRISVDAGATKTVDFLLSPSQLAFWNIDMKHVAEPGAFTVFVGGSSDSLIQAEFSLTAH